MKPHRVKLPLRLGPHDFNMWAAAHRRLGIDINEVFEIEQRTRGLPGFTSTEYIIHGIKPRQVLEERKEER